MAEHVTLTGASRRLGLSRSAVLRRVVERGLPITCPAGVVLVDARVWDWPHPVPTPDETFRPDGWPNWSA